MRFSLVIRALFLAVAVASAQAVDLAGLQPIGGVSGVSGVTRRPQGVELSCADGGTVQITVLAADLVRVRTLFAGQPAAPDHSWAVARTMWDPVPWTLAEGGDRITISTAELETIVHRSPLRIEFRDAADHRTINVDAAPAGRDPKSGRVGATKRLGFSEHFYGLGEKAAPLDKRRGEYVMWNSDTPGYVEGTDPIYQSIPFYIGLEHGRAYGLFYDNSYRSIFDLGKTTQEHAAYAADGGILDYYFFYGPAAKKVVGRYTELTGRMPLPPLWALGNQQSRYSYYPASMVEEVVREYRARDLPLDVVYLDIHYMDGYRVFTWNPERFPDPAGMADRLRRQGVKVVTIVDPGVKYQPEGGYRVYDEGAAKGVFLRRADGRPYIGEVWPGKAVFVDYTREDARRWWGDMHRVLLDGGVAGIWTDMNEPSDFVDKSGETQRDVVFDDLGARTPYAKNRNVFALNMARATYEGLARLRPNERPFVITRAGYAGVQRYSTVWTGDNNATFDSLALSIPMFATLGLSGESFVGADLPGFIGRGSGELLARSYELAWLVPLCRNHGAIDNYDHEPWRFGAPYEGIVRKYLRLRYQLLPYLYTTLEESHRTGVPFFRPLLLEFQDDETTWNLDDEFMVGAGLLAAPVVRAGERGRDVYLPAGRWYDFWTGTPVNGGELRRCEAPLGQLPLFVRAGTILPSTVPMSFVGEKPWNPVRFDIYPDEQGTAAGTLYEDDGATPAYRDGNYRRTALRYERSADGATIGISAPTGTHQAGGRRYEVTIHTAPAFSAVAVDREPLPEIQPDADAAGWWRDAAGALHVRLADDSREHTVHLR